jgi:hypothetical protein
LCVPDDFVCSNGRDFNAHMEYAETGMVDQAADFTASRVLAESGPATPSQPLAPAAPAPQPSAPAAPAPQPLAPAAPAPQPPAPAPPPPESPAPAPPPFNALRPLPPGTLLRCDTTCHIIGPA